MKVLTFLILLCFLCVTGVEAQDMSAPAPVENPVYEAMVGTWIGANETMGMNMQAKIRWDLNHQFLFVEIESVSKDDTDRGYKGVGIYGVDRSGDAKMWWFDGWGVEGMMEGTGTFEGMKLIMRGENEIYRETRTIEWNEQGQMIMSWEGVMRLPTGDMKMEGVQVYDKQ